MTSPASPRLRPARKSTACASDCQRAVLAWVVRMVVLSRSACPYDVSRSMSGQIATSASAAARALLWWWVVFCPWTSSTAPELSGPLSETSPTTSGWQPQPRSTSAGNGPGDDGVGHQRYPDAGGAQDEDFDYISAYVNNSPRQGGFEPAGLR